MKKAFLTAAVLLMIFCGHAVVAQAYDEDDDVPYLADEDMDALENLDGDTAALETFDGDMGELEPINFTDTPYDIEVKTSEMPRLNASQPLYHLLILDRLQCPLNSDISDTGSLSLLYKYRHGRNGYLIALYKSAAGGPVFPQLPSGSRVMADLMSVRVSTIREYIRSSAFRRFVTNRRILSGMNAVLRSERSGGYQEIASEAETNEMPRLNASQPLYHLLILERLYSPLNSDISDTGALSVLYKYKHGRNGYLIALYKSAAGGPVFPQLPAGSRIVLNLSTARPDTIGEYIKSNAFRRYVTNRTIRTRLQEALGRTR